MVFGIQARGDGKLIAILAFQVKIIHALKLPSPTLRFSVLKSHITRQMLQPTYIYKGLNLAMLQGVSKLDLETDEEEIG